jgi:hypothetical protein
MGGNIMSDTIKFSLRIPTNLHSDLKELADRDMRSLNMYILKVLETHVETNTVRRDKNVRSITKQEDVFYVDINMDDK